MYKLPQSYSVKKLLFLYFYAIIMKKTTMWKENLYQPIEVLLREHDEFPIGEHQHSFFEMAYIVSGNGSFRGQTPAGGQEGHEYSDGDLFLIPPNRPHLFVIHAHSRFVFVRFTETYAADYISPFVEKSLETAFQFKIPFRDADAGAVQAVMQLIRGESASGRRLSGMLTQYYVNSIILLAARNLSEPLPETEQAEDDRAQYLLEYIQQHIHQPELLKLEVLADKFHLSPTYAGRFFKRNFGEDFRQYVSLNRLRRVEEMLVNTRMSIKEIAAHMGYVDSCYLNKLFRQHHGMTPIQFRKKNTGSHLAG